MSYLKAYAPSGLYTTMHVSDTQNVINTNAGTNMSDVLHDMIGLLNQLRNDVSELRQEVSELSYKKEEEDYFSTNEEGAA